MFRVKITRNGDGEKTTYTDDISDDLFIWEDGNYACDCNRGLLFSRSRGEPDPEVICGVELFSVTIFDENGEVVYYD